MKRFTFAGFVLLIGLGAALAPPAVADGGSDARFPNCTGARGYSISRTFDCTEGANAHGLNMKVPVESLYDELEFQYRLGKRLGCIHALFEL